ncbi:PIN domain-containing protein [Jiella sp. M17.18]|uniref:PIN domain-containing protein n=1 Tax=Jiella sp. M17.18 TaxID=3234247 RepID=UPI0034DEF149
MYLLDTSILSETSPAAKVSRAELGTWMAAASPLLFLSVVTAAEIHSGIEKPARQGASRKAALLGEWWAAVEHLYGERILPFDRDAARLAGILIDRGRALGREVGFADVAIAATAARRGFTVLTRNVKDFEPLGVPCLNPLEALPPLER